MSAVALKSPATITAPAPALLPTSRKVSGSCAMSARQYRIGCGHGPARWTESTVVSTATPGIRIRMPIIGSV